MSVEIIYEKKYPHSRPKEKTQQEEIEVSAESDRLMLTFDEIYAKMTEDVTYVLIPERIKSSEEFVQTAIEVSELCELDTKITRHINHISVSYSFNCCGGMRHINRVFAMADEFAFFKDACGWDITISIDYYTHAMVRRNRIVAP